MKRLLLSVLLLLFASSMKATGAQFTRMHSDTTGKWYDTELVPRIAFIQSWRSMLDASVALRIKPMGKYPFTSHSISAGAEWNYGFQKYLFGFKVGYTYLNEIFDYTGYTVGGSVVYFPDRSNGGLYLQPQVAYEVLEIFELMAQYNIPLNAPSLNYRVNSFSAGLRVWLR